MKNFLLWLLVLIVLLQVYTAVEIRPEFHVLSHDAYLKQLDDIKKLANGSQDVINIAYNEYFNGRYGKNLVNCTLGMDIVMLLLLAIIIKKRHDSPKNPLVPRTESDRKSDTESRS
jgi:uncharacterized protein YxeA